MKNTILALFTVLSISLFAQDSTQKECYFKHEMGVNTTMLLKQVFNLSNNTFPTLPYDLTYKAIHNKWAIRSGIGITITNFSAAVTITSTSVGSSPPGPDPIAPTTTNSSNIFYRAGFEKRYTDGRLTMFAGIDFVLQHGKSHSQSSSVFNNLPNSYSYSKTTNDLTTMGYGGGPVAGFQFFLTKKLSLFTEMPCYFIYTSQKEITSEYQNQLSSFSGNYVSSEDEETIRTKGMKLSVTLPVTIYLAYKF